MKGIIGCGKKVKVSFWRVPRRNFLKDTLNKPPATIPGLRGPQGQQEYNRLGGHGARHEIYIELRKRFGDVFALDVEGLSAVVVTHPEDIRKVYSQEGKYPVGLAQVSAEYVEQPRREVMDYSTVSVATAVGEEWKQMRNKLQKDITPPPVAQSYLPLISQSVQRLVESYPSFPYEYAATMCSLEMFHKVLYGHDMGFPTSPIVEKNPWFGWMISGKQLFESAWMYSIVPPEMREKIKETMKEAWKGVYDPMAASSLKTLQSAEDWKKEPVKPYLIRYAERTSYPIEKVVSDAGSLLFPAVDTTAITIECLIYNLASFPKAQEKLYQEVSTVTKNGPLLEEHMRSIPYLRACLKENFRLSPLGPGNGRILPSEISLQGHIVPPNTFIELSGIPYSWDESIFSHAQEFLPERWLQQESEGEGIHDHPYLVLPFGIGSRICLGSRVAETEIMALITGMVQKYYISLKEPHQRKYSVTSTMRLNPIPAFNFQKRF